MKAEWNTVEGVVAGIEALSAALLLWVNTKARHCIGLRSLGAIKGGLGGQDICTLARELAQGNSSPCSRSHNCTT